MNIKSFKVVGVLAALGVAWFANDAYVKYSDSHTVRAVDIEVSADNNGLSVTPKVSYKNEPYKFVSANGDFALNLLQKTSKEKYCEFVYNFAYGVGSTAIYHTDSEEGVVKVIKNLTTDETRTNMLVNVMNEVYHAIDAKQLVINKIQDIQIECLNN